MLLSKLCGATFDQYLQEKSSVRELMVDEGQIARRDLLHRLKLAEFEQNERLKTVVFLCVRRILFLANKKLVCHYLLFRLTFETIMCGARWQRSMESTPYTDKKGIWCVVGFRAVSTSQHPRFGTCCYLISRTVMLVATSSSRALRLGSLCKPTHKRCPWELCLSGALRILHLIDWWKKSSVESCIVVYLRQKCVISRYIVHSCGG